MSRRNKSYLSRKLSSLLRNTLDLALKRRARWIVEHLNPKKGEKILDAGCGDGFYLHILSQLGLRLKLVGIDNDKRALRSARRNLANKHIRLIYADLAKKLPFKNESFDKIVMSEVLEHLPNDVSALKEIRRVLKNGGVACISVPNHNYPFLWDPINWILERLFKTHIKSGFFAGIWNQHERLYEGKQLRSVVEKAGFKVLDLKSLTFWCLPFNHYLINLGARILARKTSSTIVTQGADKFSRTQGKSILVRSYFELSNLIDKINDLWIPKDSGVSSVASLLKIK